MAFAQTTTFKYSKCFWRRSVTHGDTLPIVTSYDHCPLCGSPTTTTSRIASPFDHALGALPLAAALAAGALALDTLLKLAGKKST